MDTPTARATQLFKARIQREYDAAQFILFGSRARRTQYPESDADVAVILRGMPTRFLPTKLAMADVAFDVLLETGILVQPLPIWEDEWNHPDDYSNPKLLRDIARDGEIL